MELTLEGYSQVSIAEKLGYTLDSLTRVITNYIKDNYSYLPIVTSDFGHGPKDYPTFSDLQYNLLGPVILGYAFDGVKYTKIYTKFKGIKDFKMCNNILLALYGLSYSEIHQIGFKIAVSDIIIINPSKLQDIYTDPLITKFFKQRKTIKSRLKQIWVANEESVNKHGFLTCLKIAVIAPFLAGLLRSGLNFEEIAENIEFFSSKEEVIEWTCLIFDLQISSSIDYNSINLLFLTHNFDVDYFQNKWGLKLGYIP